MIIAILQSTALALFFLRVQYQQSKYPLRYPIRYTHLRQAALHSAEAYKPRDKLSDKPSSRLDSTFMRHVT